MKEEISMVRTQRSQGRTMSTSVDMGASIGESYSFFMYVTMHSHSIFMSVHHTIARGLSCREAV